MLQFSFWNGGLAEGERVSEGVRERVRERVSEGESERVSERVSSEPPSSLWSETLQHMIGGNSWSPNPIAQDQELIQLCDSVEVLAALWLRGQCTTTKEENSKWKKKWSNHIWDISLFIHIFSKKQEKHWKSVRGIIRSLFRTGYLD